MASRLARCSAERGSIVVGGETPISRHATVRAVREESVPGSLYERVGGRPWFEALVERFYDGVAEDPVLRPLYPDDLRASRENLTGFLVQYWGGPATYSQQRGHPRLRMRHAPFRIGPVEAAAWYLHMEAAVRAAGLDPDDEGVVLEYFRNAARHLINHPG
jgi:hemoglobin